MCSLVDRLPNAPPVIGVCKEQETEEKPDELGIGEFDSQYFSCGTLYLDEDRALFDLWATARSASRWASSSIRFVGRRCVRI